MANPFTVQPDSLTLGELTAIEELTDWTIPDIMAAFVNGEGAQYASFMLALQLIAGKREDAAYTLVDAGAVVYMDLIPQDDEDTVTLLESVSEDETATDA